MLGLLVCSDKGAGFGSWVNPPAEVPGSHTPSGACHPAP